MGYLAVLSLERERAAGLAAVSGVTLGLLILGLAAGFGFGTLISDTRWLYETLRWSGVAYLVWLAWDSYREALRPPEAKADEQPLGVYFRRGLLSNLLNPKAALFYITVLPNFVDQSGPKGQQSLTLTMVYVAVATAIHAGIALAAATLQGPLASPRFRRATGVASAILLVGLAIWLGISTRRVW